MKNPVDEAFDLLKRIIPMESFSGGESCRASFIFDYLFSKGVNVKRFGNNIVATSSNWNENMPVLMLNTHLDTVKPSEGYSSDPFDPGDDQEVVRGLGSNDAGASVVSMISVFLLHCGVLKHTGKFKSLPFNLLLLLSAEEETSGPDGISMAIKKCGKIDAAIVGEPTCMRAAIAERGLLVLDGIAKGVSGHAARDEGVNALYIALEDINRLRGFMFDKHSALMGDVKLTVTQINGGIQHNVVPDSCFFVVDIRPTDVYTNTEILAMLSSVVKSDLHARNLENKSSSTPKGHPFFNAISKSCIESFISPTTSDWMRLDIPAIKIGPGDSARSHRPDEFVTKEEIKKGLWGYMNLIENLKL